ncbi:endopeptidase La [Tumebacillus sp. ITR2]|uniref:Lon protease n=1 Tax=Tumebacillus amylolyticus TaxID=2801339 RepID=A0ABS1JA33_9BACL|nr:endopeptidase La [Tumebacillus amylolyticus]MBL0387136.1 endopeptidase La [Tumebacillus amylolyticus]
MGITRTKRRLPLLPLRGLLIYPTMVMHLDVGRDKSVKALEKAMVGDNLILLVSQVETHIDDPEPDEIFEMGTIARVKQMLKLPNGTMRVLIEGLNRAKILEYLDSDDFYLVEAEELPEKEEHDPEIDALMRAILHQFEQYIKISKKITQETLAAVTDIDDPGRLADAIASHLTLKIKDKQVILEAVDVKERLDKLLKILSDEREVIELERKINQRVRKQMEKTQKEYYLREQLKAIQKELGEKEGRAGEADELREELAAKNLPDEVRTKVEKEIERLEKMPSTSAEGSVIRTYIDWILALPWSEESESEIDIKRAEEVLDEEHYGLEKVKERILEYLAVQALVKKLKGPILCLAGPPGVGKTSLARSIAKALNRKFVRVSLGGVRDEAEIRGHRRTYVGAMPGRIIQGMKTAGESNPLFLLDEIDKMTSDFRGDPSSALLEVLDPEQNSTFSDHYIETPYDLSNVLFITTANVLHNIPGPLMDRMEVINLSGYTEVEKLHIAKNHLLKKQIENHGLTMEQVEITDDSLYKVIRGYTREAGVRSLERQIAALCRKAAKQVVSGEAEKVVITPDKVEEYLGGERFRFGMAEKENQVGVVTGLAWTSVGGDTLSIEASIYPGKGKLTLTGQLGDVMKESAQAAFSYIRSRADQLGIDPDFLEKNDIHLHIPEGAIPKDGPSAGISMCTALISAMTGIPVRREVAMTGEITLRGHVLPIGGVKEKSMSAHRAGITTILLPIDNKKDIEDIPESVRNELTLHLVEHMDQVLEYALTSKPEPKPALQKE